MPQPRRAPSPVARCMTRATVPVNVPPPLRLLMMKAVRLVLALCALAATVAVVAGCGGVPGNAVAEVDGTAIDKDSIRALDDTWPPSPAARRARRSPTLPTSRTASRRSARPRRSPPRASPRRPTSSSRSSASRSTSALRDQVIQLLTSFQWIQGEAEEHGHQGHRRRGQEVLRRSRRSRASRRRPTTRSSSRTTARPRTTSSQRVKLDLLSNKIREKIIKGKDKVSDAQIKDFYDKNKDALRPARAARPADRPDQERGEGQRRPRRRSTSGESWKAVAKKYSIDEASKAQGGKLPAQAKGTLEKSLDKAVFNADKDEARRPGQDAVRLLRVRGRQGHEGQRSRRSSRPRRRSARRCSRRTSRRRSTSSSPTSRRSGRTRTECRDGYVTQQCKNAPKERRRRRRRPAPSQPPQPTATPQR